MQTKLALWAMIVSVGWAGSALAQGIKLGMVVGTTGAFAGGEAPLVNGTKMAVEELNQKGGIGGKPVTLVIEDTGSEQTGAVNAYNRMVATAPVAIMNTTLSGFVLSQMGTIEDEGLPTFTGAASAQIALDRKGVTNLFRIRTSDSRIAVAATQFALGALGGKKIAIVRVNNEYGNGWRTAIEATLTAARTKPVIVESYEGTDRDLTPQLLRVKQSGADVLIFAGDPPNHVVAVQQIKQLGLDMKVVLSNSGVLPTTIKLYPAGSADGIYGTVDSFPAGNPATADWAARYRKAYNIEPDYSAAEYYDGVMMVAAAVAKVGDKKDAIVKELRTIANQGGLGNTYTYANKGDGGISAAIVQIQGSGLKLITEIK